MTGLGYLLIGVGALHTLFVASNDREHANGMHVLVWGCALVVAGSL